MRFNSGFKGLILYKYSKIRTTEREREKKRTTEVHCGENVLTCICSFNEMGAEADTNYRGPAVLKGAQLCCISFCLSSYYHFLSTVQI